ncbi:TEA/ATTS domain family-domain-containing protein [Crucibulum laeve]|uniref:TEA/ATTS domain family-domain-containing protein n=1 Tax=Crucibulum laeve TaxID=68775 RepID=A0A5C3LVQ7_9AGAR|nr:TEA/ATTS domain family-domain-containing protein [Crucibulum laeve]
MSFADWHSGVTVSSSQKQHQGFICMSTVADLSYTPSEEERSRDAAQIAATGRRSWKTLKGKGEAVWPPLLEAALIEALEKYQPDGSRCNKILGRFPMRNRFISDYIYESTGKRRTPKQVGSRLQQLRDTCKEEKILQLISRRHPADTDSGTSSGTPSEGRSTSLSPPPANEEHSRTVVYVDIALEPSATAPSYPVIHFINNEITTPYPVRLSPSHIISTTSNVLRSFNSTVEFASPCALVLQSTFSVYRGASNVPIHTEVVPLKCCSSPLQSAGWRYSSELAPNFWDKLCTSKDLTKYTLLQNMTPIPTNRDARDATRTVSIVYYFSYPDDLLPEDCSTTPTHQSRHSAASSHSFEIPQEQLTAVAGHQWNWSDYHQTPSYQPDGRSYEQTSGSVPRAAHAYADFTDQPRHMGYRSSTVAYEPYPTFQQNTTRYCAEEMGAWSTNQTSINYWSVPTR